MVFQSEEIKEMTVPWLFQDIRIGRKTGTALFELEQTAKKVFFRNGDVLFASSNVAEDRLGEFLMRTGRINKIQFDEASAVVIKTGKKLGAVLFKMGLLTSQELVAQVKLQVKEIVLGLFNWSQGMYRFDEGENPIEDIIPFRMSTHSLILEGVRALNWEMIRKASPPLKTIIRPVNDPLLLFHESDLEPDDQAVLSMINGKRSFEEICSASRSGDFNTIKALHLLLALRMAEKGKVKAEQTVGTEEEKIRAEEPKSASATAESKKPDEEGSKITITKEALLYAYNSLGRQSLYEVLGVTRTSTDREIRMAYLTLAKLYHPDQHITSGITDIELISADLFNAIHEAYFTLISQANRKQYDRNPVTFKSHLERDRVPARSRNIAAEKFEEGMDSFNRGNFWGAEEAFQWALRLDPANHEYIYCRGRALARIPRRGREAEECYTRAIELSPDKTEYYMELGRFYEKHGRKANALSVYTEALKRDPNSAEILQALRSAANNGQVNQTV